MSKRLFWMGMALAALLFSILACSFNFSSAKLENPRLAKDKDGTQTTTQFSPQDTFYLVGSLANAPDDTKLKATWTAVKAEGEADNTVIKEVEASGGSGAFWFELTNDAKSWPRGQYKVDLYMNDKLEQTLTFEVVGPDPTPEAAAIETEPATVEPPADQPGDAPASITNLHTTRDDGDTQPAQAFAQADEIYAHFNVDSAGGEAQVHGALIATAAEGLEPDSVYSDLDESFGNGAQWINFSSTSPWPLGRYRIEVTANGAPTQSVEIEVVSTNTVGARIENVYGALDKDGAQPASTFTPNGSIFVKFSLANAPADTNVKAVMIAKEVEGLDAGSHVTDAGGQLGDGSYYFEFFNDGPWPTGAYTIFLYLNGQFMQQVDVAVQ